MLDLEQLTNQYAAIKQNENPAQQIKELRLYIASLETQIKNIPIKERQYFHQLRDILDLLKEAVLNSSILQECESTPVDRYSFFKNSNPLWGEPLCMTEGYLQEKTNHQDNTCQRLEAWLNDQETWRTFSEFRAIFSDNSHLTDYSDMSHFKVNFNSDETVYYTDSGDILKEISTVSSRLNNQYPYLIVATLEGDLYVASENAQQHLQHSSFTKGEPILFAGMLEIKNGKISRINNHSGHYWPRKKHVLNFLNLLQTKYGISLENIIYSTFDHRIDYTASDYLETQGNNCPLKEDSPEEAYQKFYKFYKQLMGDEKLEESTKEIMKNYLDYAFKFEHPSAYIAKSKLHIFGWLDYDKNLQKAFELWQQIEEKASYNDDFGYVWSILTNGRDEEFNTHKQAYFFEFKGQHISGLRR